VTQPDYEIEWARPARRALARLPEKVAAAVVEFIYGPLAENPQRVGKALRFELDGLHSARRGDHRIIYRILDDEGRIVIEAVDHRSSAYRRR
jgi:mRNA-degrading endonuclease RelE of RelBE toxin-antitoxin system